MIPNGIQICGIICYGYDLTPTIRDSFSNKLLSVPGISATCYNIQNIQMDSALPMLMLFKVEALVACI